MTTLIQDEINKIIDSVKPYAKLVCDRTYNKVIKEIGDCDQFKAIINRSFDIIADIEINRLRDHFNDAFKSSHIKRMDIVNIAMYLEMYKHNRFTFYSIPRRSGKILTAVTMSTINQSVIQAFTEKLAEYLKVDISEVAKSFNLNT